MSQDPLACLISRPEAGADAQAKGEISMASQY